MSPHARESFYPEKIKLRLDVGASAYSHYMGQSIRIKDLPQPDRPRERLLTLGAEALSDAELLAVQLGAGSARYNALALAQTLLAEWHGISGLARADIAELARTSGVGTVKASRIIASFALAQRSVRAKDTPRISESSEIATVARSLIGNDRVERAVILVANTQHQLKRADVIAQGDNASCTLSVRQVLAHTLRHDGAAFALAHNHPSGALTPSDSDITFTAQLWTAAAEVGLRCLDHVIVSEQQWRSVLWAEKASAG